VRQHAGLAGPCPSSREPLPQRLHRVGDPGLGLEAVTSGRASANRDLLGNVGRGAASGLLWALLTGAGGQWAGGRWAGRWWCNCQTVH